MSEVVIPYKPRPFQQKIHDELKRFNVIVAHRRFGKTALSVNQLLKDVLTCPLKNPQGAYIAPLYSQAKRISWQMFKEYAGVIPGVKFNESELRIDLPNNGKIYLCGADNPDSLRGISLDSVIIDEFSQCNPRVWTEVLRPALADRKGKAIFIATPMGMNAFYDLYEAAEGQEDWYRILLTAEDTNVIDPKELEAAKNAMGIDQFNQEFMCSWSAAIKGAFYSNELQEARQQGRIVSFPWEPSSPVHTAFDLGYSDSTAIWFVQVTGGEFRVIDYEEHNNTSLVEIIKQLKEKPYLYERSYGPHDLRVHELSSGRTRLEIAADLGWHFDVVPKLPVADGIELGRLTIRRAWFNKDKCEQGIRCLEQYRRKWDDKRQVFLKQPLHDWTSHGADAWRYLATAYEDLLRVGRVGKPRVKRAIQ